MKGELITDFSKIKRGDYITTQSYDLKHDDIVVKFLYEDDDCIHVEDKNTYYDTFNKDREWYKSISLSTEKDNVNHPKHYTSHPSGVECIEITRHHSFAIGSAIKYLWRQGLKDDNSSIQDLNKAIWYIKDEIAKQEGK